MNTEKHDIVIPLGIKSFENENFEIKVAVASIKKFCTFVNRIIIVSQIQPIKSLGDDIVWIYQDDIYTHDKDANIIEKVRQAIEQIPDLTDDFLMWSDDQFVTKETNWEDTIPRFIKIYNESTKDFFNEKAKRRIWWKRLIKCFERFPNNGYGCRFFNPHIPSRLNKTKFIDEMIFKINNISKLNSEYKNKLIVNENGNVEEALKKFENNNSVILLLL